MRGARGGRPERHPGEVLGPAIMTATINDDNSSSSSSSSSSNDDNCNTNDNGNSISLLIILVAIIIVVIILIMITMILGPGAPGCRWPSARRRPRTRASSTCAPGRAVAPR